MSNYYRIAIDFEYTESPEDLETIFDTVLDSVVKIIDNHVPGDDCVREWTVFACDVTAEYMEEDVTAFKNDLHDDDAVTQFMDSLNYKDYPPES